MISNPGKSILFHINFKTFKYTNSLHKNLSALPMAARPRLSLFYLYPCRQSILRFLSEDFSSSETTMRTILFDGTILLRDYHMTNKFFFYFFHYLTIISHWRKGVAFIILNLHYPWMLC